MPFLARPQRAVADAAPPSPHLRGGFDLGFCVRGAARDGTSGPDSAAATGGLARRRAPAFASLSHALFQLAAAPAPPKCVARAMRAASRRQRNNPIRGALIAERCADTPARLQARRAADAALQRRQGPRRRALHVPRPGAQPRQLCAASSASCLYSPALRRQALGFAALKSVTLSSAQEEREADLLLGACREALCTTLARRNQYPDAVMNIKTEMKLDEYCRRIQHPGFWGGEAELLILVRGRVVDSAACVRADASPPFSLRCCR